MPRQKLRWGIIGSAFIAKNSVIPGIKESEMGEVVAIASRDKEKANKFANELGIPKAYGSYEALLKDDSIDAVYIPLPNHLHKDWTIRAAQAGKHVLCEKPIALNTEEAKRMVEACENAGVILAEAFMYRYHPRYARIKEIIKSGEIGTIRGIHGAYTFNNSHDNGNIRHKREWGGGGIYDVGCYPISAARLILDSEPEAVTVHAFLSPDHDYVDVMASGLLEFPNHIGVTFDCGIWAAPRNTLEIVGSNGRIEVPSAIVADTANFFVHTNNGKREEEVYPVNQYALQADEFAMAVFHNSLKFQPSDAVSNMRVIDACLKSCKERARVFV